MDRINNFGIIPFIVLSILVHSLVYLGYSYNRKKQNNFISVPFEVSFYSPVQKAIDTPVVKKVIEEKKEIIEEAKKEEIKKVEVTKDDIVIKKKEKKKIEKKVEPVKVEQPKVEEPVVKEENSKSVSSTSSQVMSNSKGIMLENKNFKFAYYTNTVIKKIRRYWQWSGSIERDKVVVVYFKILKDGTVSDVKIAESSKREDLDQNAIRAVQLSSPFAPLPSGYNEDYLGVYFAFNFKEN